MVEATKVTGVRKFVFSGVIHPSISKMANHAAKLPVEEAMYESGLDFIVLQPTMFMRLSTITGAACLSADKALPYAKLASGGSGVDRRKAGIWHVRVVCPGMVNRVELAAMMSETLGRNIEAGEPSFDEWARMANIPDGPLREGLAHMYADYDLYGFPGGNALVLRAILGREPRTLQQYLRELANR